MAFLQTNNEFFLPLSSYLNLIWYLCINTMIFYSGNVVLTPKTWLFENFDENLVVFTKSLPGTLGGNELQTLPLLRWELLKLQLLAT